MSEENPNPEDVEFGPLKDALREHQYPVTRTELIEVYGGFEFDLPEGNDRLDDILGRVDTETFRNPREVRDAILAGVAEGDVFEGSVDGDIVSADAGDWSRKSM